MAAPFCEKHFEGSAGEACNKSVYLAYFLLGIDSNG